jgi:Glycosyl transferases group 1
LAADVIVNEWGFKDYRLDLYGGLDRSPAYTVECQEIIASKALRQYVTLKGYGNPQSVLADTWVFMNSSISEGLPLAIGEAALTGAPIVCTDVGATFQVLTDPDDPKKRYGSVLAPNNYRSLARAQIAMLAVMDEWQIYGNDETPVDPFPEQFTPEDVARITKRMYDKTAERRNLGLRLRTIVQKSFSGDRYLREHEQMLWLGKHRCEGVRQSIAREHNETVIDMLDDVEVNAREYRPAFQRHFSENSKVIDSPADVTTPSETSLYLGGPSRSEQQLGENKVDFKEVWRDSSEEDLEKGV